MKGATAWWDSSWQADASLIIVTGLSNSADKVYVTLKTVGERRLGAIHCTVDPWKS
jgi:hypothetical protein